MDVYVCTHGRATRVQQHTLRALQDSGWPVRVVIQQSEIDKWGWQNGTLSFVILPANVQTIAATRDYLIHEADDSSDRKLVMFDDDLHFAVRRTDEPHLFRPPTSADISDMLRDIQFSLDHYPMVGIGPREGGNRNTETFLYNTRIMRVIGVDRNYFKENHICCGAQQYMEDFHLNLQVLRSGRDTQVVNRYVSNQAGGSNAPGGCSIHRTPNGQDAAARALAARHPGFVRVVQKATKTAWGGGVRTDVVVSWKKARESAL